jgi:agmatine/peptidylarginine deiminase
MHRYFALLILTVLVPFSLVHAQPDEREKTILPRYETAEERLLRSSILPPAGVAVLPPAHPVRTMAEFEELEGIVVRWAYGTFDLLLSQIVDAAQEEGKVWILVRPSTSDSNNIKTYLASRNIPLTNIEFLSINSNSIWCRDYGPWTVYDVMNDSLGIVDFRYNRPARPQDDVVNVALAQRWSVPLYQTVQMPDSLVHTGGNFMVDGYGTGFSSRLIVDENPHLNEAQVDTIMAKYCGLIRFVKMNTLLYDEIHHIDMHMKLLDEETLLIGQYPVNMSDYAMIENTVNYLRTLSDCYGRPFRIVRIPMPPSLSGGYPPNSNYFTYTNSLIVNKTVLVPIYGFPLDEQALQIYRDAMPGYNIVAYDCNAIIPSLGAIHCITKEIGVREPVQIVHGQLTTTRDTAHDYRVAARIKVRSGVDSGFVFWRKDTSQAFTRIQLTDSSGTFVGYIPRQSNRTRVWYYVAAKTGSGRIVTKPLVAPAGTFRFDVTDSSATSIGGNDAPTAFSLSQNYPNPFNPATVIAYSIPDAANVTLKVFNTLGEEVQTLFNGRQQRGSYTALWDASSFPTGTYFYRLTVSGERTLHVGTRKALLLK